MGARLVAACVLLTACHLAALMVARLLYSDVAFYDRVLAPVHYLLAVGVIALVGFPVAGGLAATAGGAGGSRGGVAVGRGDRHHSPRADGDDDGAGPREHG